MKYWKVGLFFLIAFLIQTNLLNIISILGYTPNLILSLVVLFTFLYEEEIYGVVFGAAFGLLYDVLYSNVIGPMAISLVLVAIGIVIIREFANIENIINMWVVSILSIVAYYFLNWGMHHLAGNPIGFFYVMSQVPFITAYSLIFITVLYKILVKTVNPHHKDRYLL